MSATTVGLIGTGIMVLLFFSRMPVAYVMMLVGILGFGAMTSIHGGLNLLPRNIWDIFSSYDLTTIPLFILMGNLAFNSGISRKLYATAYRFMGSTRGGLAMATVSACTAFGAVCGSSAATAATMATVGLPEMRRYHYAPELSCGSVAAGGGLGMIMPPSVVLLVYGVLTEQSIGKLFAAGIIPAFVVTFLFMGCIFIWCRLRPEQGPPGERFSWAEKLKSLSGIGGTLSVFVVVMGGLFFGLFTPTEAAGVGVAAVVAVALITRQLSWEGFVDALYSTLRTSLMVMMLVAGAVIFGKFLAVTRLPFDLAGWVGALPYPRWVLMAAIIVVYFLGGCFMDSLAFVMLTVPVFYPVILHLGYDPIWFGIIIVMVTEMGVITPPVGINVYVVYGIAQNILEGIAMETVFKGIFPFFLAVIVGIVIFIMFPQIVLLIPNMMY